MMFRRRRTCGRHRAEPREWPLLVAMTLAVGGFLAWLWLTPTEPVAPSPAAPVCVAWSWVDGAGREWWGCR